MITELVQAVREHKAILFVGAGVSQNLGLPSFSGLIAHIAKELGYEPDIYNTHGDYLALAEYYQIKKGGIGELRSWMDRTWHEGKDIDKSDIHKLILGLEFPIIYTTNYDSWIERIYDKERVDYTKIVNVGDIVKIEHGKTQIIKFHGDFTDDASIVLTESSYFERLDFESGLDIKLRADILGKSLIFIGYSLGDINIRYMLYKLNKQWEKLKGIGVRPKSFIYLSRPNPVQEIILSDRGITSIVSTVDDPAEGLKEFLTKLTKEAFGRV